MVFNKDHKHIEVGIISKLILSIQYRNLSAEGYPFELNLSNQILPTKISDK